MKVRDINKVKKREKLEDVFRKKFEQLALTDTKVKGIGRSYGGE